MVIDYKPFFANSTVSSSRDIFFLYSLVENFYSTLGCIHAEQENFKIFRNKLNKILKNSSKLSNFERFDAPYLNFNKPFAVKSIDI